MRNLYRTGRSESRIGYAQVVEWEGTLVELLIDYGCLVPVETTKRERKLRDALNRITKLIPSVRRISELDRIAVELEAEADTINQLDDATRGDPFGLRADALFLRRLEYDLTSMREAKASVAPKKEKTMRASSKYDSANWPRGERP